MSNPWLRNWTFREIDMGVGAWMWFLGWVMLWINMLLWLTLGIIYAVMRFIDLG